MLSNCLIFHNTLDIAQAVRELQAEGWKVEPEDLAEVSPYLTEKIMRFGEYSTHELDLAPEAYEPCLDVDFTVLGDDEAAVAWSEAADGQFAASLRRSQAPTAPARAGRPRRRRRRARRRR